MNKQYGLQFPEGRITPYASKQDAEAAQQRMRSWPTTKYVKLKVRDYYVGEWGDDDETQNTVGDA